MDWSQLKPNDRSALWHMLGIDFRRPSSKWGFRNCYAPGGDAIASMERLERHGLVVRGRKYGETNYFHATLAGCLAAGLPEEKAREVCANKPAAGGEGKG
jgi:hypothetical protein